MALHTRARQNECGESLARARPGSFLPTVRDSSLGAIARRRLEVPLFRLLRFRALRFECGRSNAGFFESKRARLCGTRERACRSRMSRLKCALRTFADCALPFSSFSEIGQRVRVCGGAIGRGEGVFLSENGDQSLVISVDVFSVRWRYASTATT